MIKYTAVQTRRYIHFSTYMIQYTAVLTRRYSTLQYKQGGTVHFSTNKEEQYTAILTWIQKTLVVQT